MANECIFHRLPQVEANGDLSTKQFHCVKVVQGATKNRVEVCTVSGEPFVGVLQNDPDAAGKSAEVAISGVCKLVANETLTPGDFWGTSADGQGTKVEHTNTGADVRAFAMGVILEGGAAGEIVTATLQPSFVVSA